MPELFNKKDFLEKLGARIAYLRKLNGHSQDGLCLLCGFARGTLSKIERGRVDPKATSLARIARELEIPLKKLTHF